MDLMQTRISSLDFLRGIAVLGILIINIESFAYPLQFNPYLYGFASEVDVTVRYWVYYFAQGKFFSLFVMLFGVSFQLMLERLQQKHNGVDSVNIYTRRLLILFVFGLAHAYLIWSGDILHHYAICALLLLPMRSFTKRGLGLFAALMLLIIIGSSYERANKRAEQKLAYQQVMAIDEQDRTQSQQRTIWRWEAKLEEKSTERYSAIEATYKGSYLDIFKSNWDKNELYKGDIFFKGILFESLMLMTIGILLCRLNIFSDYRNMAYYWPITLVLVGIGLWMGYIKYQWWSYDYLSPITTFHLEFFRKTAHYVQGLSYLLLLNGLYQVIPAIRKLTVINQVGKMALSSYIFHSIVCAFIFYGYGLNYHNELSRSELLGLIVAIWLINFALCHVWLKFNKQGPLESIWRRLSHQAS
jgi:uncharacterized protein